MAVIDEMGAIPLTDIPGWWHDLRCQCRHCGCVYRLDPRDEVDIRPSLVSGYEQVVESECPTCRRKVRTYWPLDPPHPRSRSDWQTALVIVGLVVMIGLMLFVAARV